MPSRGSLAASAALLVVACAGGVAADEDHRYQAKDFINLFGDSLIPDANPSESYPYFDLAFCKPKDLMEKKQSLGEILGGSRKMYLRNYRIQFASGTPKTILCDKRLSREEVAHFRAAILDDWRVTLYFDDIPLKTLIGVHDQKGGVSLWTHYHFEFSFNADRVIEANIHTTNEPDHKIELPADDAAFPAEGVHVAFTYSTAWKATTVQWEDRPANNPKEILDEEIDIQWFAIINSFILVVLLTSFLAFITIRLLKKDFQRYVSPSPLPHTHTRCRYNPEENEEPDEETGWKLIHADVFRFPPYPSLFCSMLGCGVQLGLIFLSMLSLSVLGVFYAYGRGTMYATIIVIYSQTSIVAGYVAGSHYKKLGGDQWVHNVLITCGLFVLPVFVIWSILNSVAWAQGSTSALPAGTVVGLFALFLLVAFPLTLAGMSCLREGGRE